MEDGIVILQHAATQAHSEISSNPSELSFQMISRLSDSTSTNKVVHMFIKCLLLYSDRPVVFAPECYWQTSTSGKDMLGADPSKGGEFERIDVSSTEGSSKGIATKKEVLKVNFCRVPDFMNTAGKSNGYDTSEEDISLFQYFTEAEERFWCMQDCAFLNQFSDGIAIYSDPSEIPQLLQMDSNIVSTLIIESEESEKSVSDTIASSELIDELGESIEALSGDSYFTANSDTGVPVTVSLVVVFDIRYLMPIGL